jgi:ComF family protein
MAIAFSSPMQAWTHELRKSALDLVFPPTCIVCRRVGDLLCPTCAQTAKPVGDKICLQCGRPQAARVEQCPACHQQDAPPLTVARAAALHGGPVRAGIHHLKYGGDKDLAPVLARYLQAAFLLEPWATLTIDAVAPIPLHAARLRTRGYNQAELLATAFCRQVQLPHRPHWLERIRSTHSQVGLNAHERQRNVADAFRALPAVRGKHLLLIDDVYTTGATLRACARAALDAGATSVYALTLAAPEHG